MVLYWLFWAQKKARFACLLTFEMVGKAVRLQLFLRAFGKNRQRFARERLAYAGIRYPL